MAAKKTNTPSTAKPTTNRPATPTRTRPIASTNAEEEEDDDLTEDSESEDEDQAVEDQEDDTFENNEEEAAIAQQQATKYPKVFNATGPANTHHVLKINHYDPMLDHQVPHSGTTDPDGTPRYDESPIRGGNMIVETTAPNGRKFKTNVNAKGHEIDPKTGNQRQAAKVVNPERYKRKTDDEDDAFD